MTSKHSIALCAAIVCLFLPVLCRFPNGLDFALQYFPSSQHIGGWLLLFGFPNSIPGIIVYFSIVLSKPEIYFVGLSTTIVTYTLLVFWHYNNDLGAGPESSISLIIIPIRVSVISFSTLVVGICFRLIFDHLKCTSRF